MASSGGTRPGVRLAVILTGAIGVLSLITGVVNLTSASQFEPIARYIPELVRRTVALTGAFTGFAMLVSAWGLKRRLRSAWYSAVVLLPVTALQGVVQSSPFSFPLIILSVLAMPTVIINRRGFSRELSFSPTQSVAGLAIVGILSYGTIGSYVLSDEFNGIRTPLDAFYYTLVTASTVGYGDFTPQTQLGRAFTLSLIVVGTAGFGLAIAALLTPAIESRLKNALGKMTTSQLELLENHVIILGYGDLTEPIVRELEGQIDFIVVTKDADVAKRLSERGYMVLNADPSDEDALEKARIDTAVATVAATASDAEDSLSVLTARQLNPDIRIVAAATELENVNKLKRAGADTVISPASIVGHLLVESALSGTDTEEIADKIIEEKVETNVEEEETH